ncbi:acyltransferase [Caproicibacter sp.]|uniref:acyltransferase n=1 Tax=Caproicibacter sp. TaxID=2814884 RepID=UPI003989A798
MRLAHELSLSSAIRYNFFCGHVRKSGGKIIPYSRSVFLFGPNGRLIIRGNFRTNVNCIKRNGRSTIVRVDRDAVLETGGEFTLYYGGDIIVFENAKLFFGKDCGCNSDVKIRCTRLIEIGDRTFISHNVTILDSDSHELCGTGSDMTKPIRIGSHVLIGTHATILKGAVIGDHSVIAANAVVTGEIPAHCLAAGIPARVIRENINWK